MTISIVTDELGLELEPAIEAIKSWGLDHVELRGVVGGRYPDGFLEGTAKLVSENGLTVTALSPGVFKCLPEKDIIAKHLERLQIAVSGAPMFGADQVIVFSVESPDGDPPQQMVVDAFKRASDIAGEVGVRLLIENEPGFFAVSSRSLAALIELIDRDNVGANWDPGNAFDNDYEIDMGAKILGDKMWNVHAKDVVHRDGERLFDSLGLGEIDWQTQLQSIKNAGYDGPICVETHCLPGVPKSKESLEKLRQWMSELQ